MMPCAGQGVCRKKPIGSVDAELAKLRAERQEMIILHPERGVGLVEAQQRARHERVDFAVGEVVALRRADQVAA